jgi:hypothetical protein
MSSESASKASRTGCAALKSANQSGKQSETGGTGTGGSVLIYARQRFRSAMDFARRLYGPSFLATALPPD